jgi:hypothetical protein
MFIRKICSSGRWLLPKHRNSLSASVNTASCVSTVEGRLQKLKLTKYYLMATIAQERQMRPTFTTMIPQQILHGQSEEVCSLLTGELCFKVK